VKVRIIRTAQVFQSIQLSDRDKEVVTLTALWCPVKLVHDDNDSGRPYTL